MPQTTANVNRSTYAPIENVSRASASMERIINASSEQPRMAVLYGRAGLGKTSAACYLMNRYNAYRIECTSVMTRKYMLEYLLRERMGILPAKTLPEMLDQVIKQLQRSGRPLIIDEFDYLVDKSAVEIVRDIHDGSQAPVMFIGEEHLPGKLKRWERLSSRVLDWTQVMPLSLNDAAILADHYCRTATVTEDLLAHIHVKSEGSARRIVVNLAMAEEKALSLGITVIDLAAWGSAQLYSGDAPTKGGKR
jgi:DNA transposition AAA+ family ATPase